MKGLHFCVHTILSCPVPLARGTDVQIAVREAEAHLRVCTNSINFTKTIKTVPLEAGSGQDTTKPTESRVNLCWGTDKELHLGDGSLEQHQGCSAAASCWDRGQTLPGCGSEPSCSCSKHKTPDIATSQEKPEQSGVVPVQSMNIHPQTSWELLRGLFSLRAEAQRWCQGEDTITERNSSSGDTEGVPCCWGGHLPSALPAGCQSGCKAEQLRKGNSCPAPCPALPVTF